MRIEDCWHKKRNISIVVDNESWFLPYAQELVRDIGRGGDTVQLCRTHSEVPVGDVAFYLSCVKITPREILNKNTLNLVVHASELPKGKGFAPIAWQVLDSQSQIVFCLIEAADSVDAGDIYHKETVTLDGTELCDELREIQGRKVIEICTNFLALKRPPIPTPQSGKESVYPRRRPADSELDIHKTIEEQFNLLRVVDNQRYPAFFTHKGTKYTLQINKSEEQ